MSLPRKNSCARQPRAIDTQPKKYPGHVGKRYCRQYDTSSGKLKS
jgi:hypothetical protein